MGATAKVCYSSVESESGRRVPSFGHATQKCFRCLPQAGQTQSADLAFCLFHPAFVPPEMCPMFILKWGTSRIGRSSQCEPLAGAGCSSECHAQLSTQPIQHSNAPQWTRQAPDPPATAPPKSDPLSSPRLTAVLHIRASRTFTGRRAMSPKASELDSNQHAWCFGPKP